MIVLKSDNELKLTFQKLIKMMGVPVEWNGLFFVIGDYLILQGKVRSLFFNFDTKLVVTNIIDLQAKEEEIVPVTDYPQVKDILNMVLYAFGKWGHIKGLKVDKDFKKLNLLFTQILSTFSVEAQYDYEHFRFYRGKIRITYEDVIEAALEENEKEEPQEEVDETQGLWHKLLWKKAAYGFLMKETTIAERRKDRIGDNFYVVGYLCPKCSNKMYMGVYPQGKEFTIETDEGKVLMARSYTCKKCCCFYTPRPEKMLIDGDVYCMDFEKDEVAYEDYLELLGKTAKKVVNPNYNQYLDRKGNASVHSKAAKEDSSEESAEELVLHLPEMSEPELFRTMRKMEEGFYPDETVEKLEQAIKMIQQEEVPKAKAKEKIPKEEAADRESETVKQPQVPATEPEESRPSGITNISKDFSYSKKSTDSNKNRNNSKNTENFKNTENKKTMGKAEIPREISVKQQVPSKEELPVSKKNENSKSGQKRKAEQSALRYLKREEKQMNKEPRRPVKAESLSDLAKKQKGKLIFKIPKTFQILKKTPKVEEVSEPVKYISESRKEYRPEKTESFGQRESEWTKKDTANERKEDKLPQERKRTEENRKEQLKKLSEIERKLYSRGRKTKEDYKNLKEEMLAQNISPELLRPYIEQVNDKIRVMDEKEINNLCKNVENMDFEDAMEVYEELEDSDFWPELKYDALKGVEKRLRKIKTDECELLVGKLKTALQEAGVEESERFHFYPAKKVFMKQALPEETAVIDYAMVSYASGVDKFEYPVLTVDKSRDASGKEGFTLTPERIYYSAWMGSYYIPIMDIERIEAVKGLLNHGIYVYQTNGTKTKLPAGNELKQPEQLAKVLEEFVYYLQEKPFSRKEPYLAKEKHETICCFRCGYVYRGSNVCPRCGFKRNE